ncbi:MAG: elongation factor P [Clostridiales bacterium]|jgi:elongation factor P|nr:elongation factor P [Clostridiales bacterium]
MVSAGDFKNGLTIEYEGEIYQILEFQHSKSGRGAAVVRSKLRNIITGSIIEKTFRPAEKMPRAHIERKDMQYLYNDGELYHFMDMESYEQIPIDAAKVGDSLVYIKENDMVKIMSHNGNIFGIEPPISVELAITDTEPGFAGNTATGATKPATLETGAVVTVPLFVNVGDIIKVDTRTGEYTGRIQQ